MLIEECSATTRQAEERNMERTDMHRGSLRTPTHSNGLRARLRGGMGKVGGWGWAGGSYGGTGPGWDGRFTSGSWWMN